MGALIGDLPPVRLRTLGLICAFSAFGALTLGCATTKVGATAAESADLSSYDTYAWVTEEYTLIGAGSGNPRIRNEDNERLIRQTVDRVMTQKGYEKVPLEQADLVVSFAVGARERLSIQGGDGRYGMITAGGARPLYEGMLSIDFFDHQSKQQIWRGWAKKPLDPDDNPYEVINEAVTRILAQFPDDAG